jgi:hypothetical protein
MNSKGNKKHFDIIFEDQDGDTYLVSINERDKEILGVIVAGLRDFTKWVEKGRMPRLDKKYFDTICDDPASGCQDGHKPDNKGYI